MLQGLVFLCSCCVVVGGFLGGCRFSSCSIGFNIHRRLFFSFGFVNFRRCVGISLFFYSLLRGLLFLFVGSLFLLIDFDQLYAVYLENQLNNGRMTLVCERYLSRGSVILGKLCIFL